jgi:hypothetical protein
MLIISYGPDLNLLAKIVISFAMLAPQARAADPKVSAPIASTTPAEKVDATKQDACWSGRYEVQNRFQL